MTRLHNEFRPYLIAGIPFIVIGLLINPWLVSWFLDSNFSLTLFAGLLIISIILIVIGWGIIFKRNKFILWFVEKYKDLALIFLNVMLLFAIINFIAALWTEKPAKIQDDVSYFYQPIDLLTDSVSLLREVYPGKSDEDINELLMLTSPYANHPVLEFQEKVQNSKYYNIGFEGIRFDKRVNSENAKDQINGSIWVFGGSTTFGQGVSDDETIIAYLNSMDSSNTYINFGVHAYHQSNEIEKMLLLLKKGYTPSKVIFLDGLNDVIRMIETNFHPLETPALAKSAYTSQFNIATRETGNYLVNQLPVARLLKSYIGKVRGLQSAVILPWNQYDNIYDPENMYNTNSMQHYQSSILRSPYKDIDTTGLNYVMWKLSELYMDNYRFLEKVSEAYGFEFRIYYQPIGILNTDNPFWRDKSTSQYTPLYRNFNYVIPKIRSKIYEWNLPSFYDISNLQDTCLNCYVDLTHYSSSMNRLIANAILTTKPIVAEKE